MSKILRIGTRDSQLAVWQASLVKDLLKKASIESELVYIKSEGDIDVITPLYELGVQGVFTKALDAALLNDRIDIAVHSMKDVPTQLAGGIIQAAVLQRASSKDIFVYKNEKDLESLGLVNGKWTNDGSVRQSVNNSTFTIATSSIRRIAQWLNRYPGHKIKNLRGNVNTRLRKLDESNWNGAIFAAAGLERIGLRPASSIDLDWMLPAPAQGAIMIVCREDDAFAYKACRDFNDNDTALCTKIERDFLRTLLGGCSTPISALAEIEDENVKLKGSIISIDGSSKFEIERKLSKTEASSLGVEAANEILNNGGREIVDSIRKSSIKNGAA
jgi:hydroxymethylbilane synthase